MAVAAAEAQATITKKSILTNSLAIYVGTLAFGNAYATGGDTLVANPESRYGLPEKLDSMLIGSGASGYDLEYVPRRDAEDQGVRRSRSGQRTVAGGRGVQRRERDHQSAVLGHRPGVT